MIGPDDSSSPFSGLPTERVLESLTAALPESSAASARSWARDRKR